MTLTLVPDLLLTNTPKKTTQAVGRTEARLVQEGKVTKQTTYMLIAQTAACCKPRCKNVLKRYINWAGGHWELNRLELQEWCNMAVAGTASTDKVPTEVLNAVTVCTLVDAKNGKKKGRRQKVEQQKQPLPLQPPPPPQPQY